MSLLEDAVSILELDPQTALKCTSAVRSENNTVQESRRILGTWIRTAIACFVCLYSYGHVRCDTEVLVVAAAVVVVAVVLATGCDTDTAGMEGGVGGMTVLGAEVVAGVCV